MERPGKLTHLGRRGAARMVDVSEKPATERVAVAEGCVVMAPATLETVLAGDAKKGDVLGAARIAGIMAAKRTHELIPLCHPLAISKAEIEIEPDRALPGLIVRATVKVTGPTGVEMAGSIVELAKRSLSDDFRMIHTGQAKVILLDAAPRVLPVFTEDLSASAQRQLEKMGVEVLVAKKVLGVDPCLLAELAARRVLRRFTRHVSHARRHLEHLDFERRPVLAICSYHRQTDLWRIPELIHSIDADYRLFIRPHLIEGWDLVCYAVPAERFAR